MADDADRHLEDFTAAAGRLYRNFIAAAGL